MWRSARTLLVAAIVALAAPAGAADFDAGVAAAQKGEYDAAMAALRPLAEKGDGMAQFHVGQMYMGGLGVRRDYAAALEWLRRAAVWGIPAAQYEVAMFFVDDGRETPQDLAEANKWLALAADQNHAESELQIGLMFRDGLGRPQSYREAVDYLRRASNRGLPESQYQLGLLYWQGKGVSQEFSRAAELCRAAAEQGHVPAQVILGYMYATGSGVPEDHVEAHKWYNLAAAGGSKEAVRDRAALAAGMSASQIAEAQRRAAAWEPRDGLLPAVERHGFIARP